jgi:CubicO group peptidase (beta-lactamase class C family)
VPRCGLLWWLIGDREEVVLDEEVFGRLEEAGVDGEFLGKLRTIAGRSSVPEYRAHMEGLFGPSWPEHAFKYFRGAARPRTEMGEIVGYAARGYLGQYVLVFPEPRLVVVRMREAGQGVDERADSFDTIDALAIDLWRHDAAASESGK